MEGMPGPANGLLGPRNATADRDCNVGSGSGRSSKVVCICGGETTGLRDMEKFGRGFGGD